LRDGVLRYVSGRPNYDGSTVVPTYGAGEIDNAGGALSGNNTHVYFQTFFQKAGILTNPTNEIDLSKTGDAATLSDFEFVISDNCHAYGAVVDIGIGFSGLIASATAGVSGTGYAIGDQLVVLGGTGGVIQITGMNNGVPSTYSIIAPGSGYSSGWMQTLPINRKFWSLLATAGPGGLPIPLVGRKVRFALFIDNVFYSRWVGVITNSPRDEVDFHFACGPDLTVHKTMPPNVVTTITQPASGIGSQQTSQVTISGAVAPQSNIPSNAVVQSDVLPVCFGDIPYAQLVNVEGIPLMERLAILGRGLYTPPPTDPKNLFNISCAVGMEGSVNAALGDFWTGPFAPSTAFKDDKGGAAFTIYDWGYALMLVQEDVQNAHGCWQGFGSTPFPMPGAILSGGSSMDSGVIDKFKDYFIFKNGDQKGIRILRSATSCIKYFVSGTDYRYLFVTVLILAEPPENFGVDNILLAPGKGYTPTDLVPTWGAPSLTSSIVADSTTFFQVCRSIIKQVVSNFSIIGYTPALINGVAPAYTANAKALPVLRSFSSDFKIYENVNNMVQNAVPIPGASDSVQFPYLQLKANADVQQNGISLLNPIIIPPSAIKKIEWTMIGGNVTDPYLDVDLSGQRVSRSVLYGTPVFGNIPPYVADSSKTTGPTVYNATDFNNLVDRDRATLFPDIKLSQQSRVPMPAGGSGGNGELAINITHVDTNGSLEINEVAIDNGYTLPTGYLPYDILYVLPSSGGGAYGKGGMIQILTVDAAGTPLTIQMYRPGRAYAIAGVNAKIMFTFNDTANPTQAYGKGYAVTFNIDITSLIDTDIDKAYFGIDFVALSYFTQKALSFGLQFYLLDQYGRQIKLGDNVSNGAMNCGANGLLDPTGNLIVRTITEQINPSVATSPKYNFLPKDYYAGGGNDNSEADRFYLASCTPEAGSGNAWAELDFKSILALVKNRIAQPTLLVDFIIIGNTVKNTGSGFTINIQSVNSGGTIQLNTNMVNGGTGYTIGDYLLIAGGLGGVIRVTGVSSGAVTTYAFSPIPPCSAGTGYSTGTKDTSPYIPQVTDSAYIDLLLQIKQIGFVTEKSVNTANKSLFTEVQGETIGNDGSTETNTVHTAIQHILEDYDKISTALIDYGNLAAKRGLGAAAPWYVGRQLNTQKNSFDYLMELCRHGFLGYYISRTGKHTFSAWQDDTSPVATHTDSDPILRGSIGGLVKTDIANVYNDFNLQYNNNPGLNKLDRSIIITHIDDRDPGVTVAAAPSHAPGGGFPVKDCVDLDGIALWTKYASWSGIPIYKGTYNPTTSTPPYPAINDTYKATATANGWTSGSYYTWTGTAWDAALYSAAWTSAQTLWNICHNSWLQSFIIQQTGNDLSQLEWFVDRAILNDLTKAIQGIGVNNTAWLLLNKLINYITKQKDRIPYSVPINAVTATLDLLKPIDFSDYIYTAGTPKLGWIEKIETDALNGKFNLQLILSL
jgi:hypothetical protein